MSKRLQVVLDDEELDQIQKVARKHHMTTAEWVRQVLRKAQRGEPGGDAKRKLAVVRAAVEHDFPAADIDDMLKEIERGYLDDKRA
jgi:hypothetical protein